MISVLFEERFFLDKSINLSGLPINRILTQPDQLSSIKLCQYFF